MEKKSITKKTTVRKEIIQLPGETKLIQSNRISNGKYKGFTLIQAKVFISIIKELQKQIKESMEGLFPFSDDARHNDPANYTVQLPLKDITDAQYYKEVIRNVDEMRSLSVEIPPPAGFKKSIHSVVVGYDEPFLKKGKKVVNIYIPRKIANILITIDRNAAGIPIQYHNYYYEVIMNSKSKYTWKLYLLISSWKNKGGFKISYASLREQLGIAEHEYKKYSDFKRRVLIPIQKELEGKADCWFNCSEKSFEIREGKEVVMLNFKVITPILDEKLQEWKDHIISILRSNYHCNDSHIRAIQSVFDDFNENLYNLLIDKLKDLNELIFKRNGTGKQVKDRASYVIKSLLEEYGRVKNT